MDFLGLGEPTVDPQTRMIRVIKVHPINKDAVAQSRAYLTLATSARMLRCRQLSERDQSAHDHCSHREVSSRLNLD
jgi:hypothetical protein